MGDVKQCTMSEMKHIKFSVKINEDENRAFVGQNNQKLEDAIMKTSPDFCTTDHILFTDFDFKVEGHSKLKAAILPSLLCGWLKDNSQIEIVKLSKKNAALQQLDAGKDLSQNPADQTIFFVKTDRAKSKDSILVLSNSDYKFRELCVSADKGDYFKKALEKDGRFANIESWKITDEADNTSPPIESEAQHYPDAVFKVTVKRSKPKRKASEVVNNLQDQIKKEAAEQEDIPVPYSAEQEDIPVPAYCPPPINSLSPFEIPQVVVKMAKSKAYELLLSPAEAKKSKQQRDKGITRLVEEQFSKKVDLRRPVWLLEKLYRATKSVGRIFFGHKTGSCFLVKKGVVMTNRHVYMDIMHEINISTVPNERKKIRVWFNHLYPNQTDKLREVFVDKVIAISDDLQLDYVLLQLEPEAECVDDLDELGAIVRCNASIGGLLTIIGHPDGHEKVEECCRVVSPYLWRSNVLETVQEMRPPAVGFDEYLFTCKQKVLSAEFNDRVAYGTNCLHGASGSPCINNDGHIIAMHACGFMVDKMVEKSVSVMEFGVLFTAIYKDLKTRYSRDLVNELFPGLMATEQTEMETD